MEYAVVVAAPDRLVLGAKRTNRIIGLLLAVPGYLLLASGLILLVASPAEAVWQVLAGFGLFFWGASNAVLRSYQLFPRQLVFDNATGTLRLVQGKHSTAAEPGTRIGFQEIAGFAIERRRDEGTETWCANLSLRDGSQWTLFTSRRMADARAFADQLTAGVNLAKKAEIAPPHLPATVQSTEQPGSIAFSWRFAFFGRRNMPSFLLITGFLWALIAIGSETDTIGMFAVLCFSAVIVAALAYFAWRWVGAKGTIEIDAREVRYAETRGKSRRLVHEIALADLEKIVGADTTGDFAIYFLTAEEHAYLQKIRTGSIGLAEVADALGFMRRVFKVYTPTLNFAERLAFAGSVRHAVEQLRRG